MHVYLLFRDAFSDCIPEFVDVFSSMEAAKRYVERVEMVPLDKVPGPRLRYVASEWEKGESESESLEVRLEVDRSKEENARCWGGSIISSVKYRIYKNEVRDK